MRLLVARALPVWSSVREAGTQPRARLAALIAAGGLLAIAAWAILAPPDHAARVQATPGGETVMAKFARTRFAEARFAEAGFGKAGAEARLPFPEPTPVGRLLSMALAPVPALAPPRKEEPNLAGLSEIPRELIWNRPPGKDKDKSGEPKAFAAFSSAGEKLPWDAVEPVPFSPVLDAPHAAQGPGAKEGLASGPPSAPVQLAAAEVETWVKTKVTEIKGADRSRPLYHFELWLEPPAEVKGRLVGVAYEFSTPAIRPQSQASSDKTSGFRISAGGLACADEITLTLRFDDGRAQRLVLDGCKLLS